MISPLLRQNDSVYLRRYKVINDADNGLSPDRYQAIIQTNAISLSIGFSGTYFSET